MKLMSQAEALRQSESFHGGKLTLTSLFHTTFRVSVPHRREIMVSLETMPFIKRIWNVYGYDQWGTKQLCHWLNEKNIRGAASCTRLSTFLTALCKTTRSQFGLRQHDCVGSERVQHRFGGM